MTPRSLWSKGPVDGDESSCLVAAQIEEGVDIASTQNTDLVVSTWQKVDDANDAIEVNSRFRESTPLFIVKISALQ